jgi:hypothetical protein
VSPLQPYLAAAAWLALLGLLGSIAWNGCARECRTFPAYVLATLVCNTLQTVWPERFLNPSFWVLKQALYDALKVAIAVELAYRTFGVFPGAWRTARAVLASLLAVSTLAVAVLVPAASYSNLYDWQPRISTAAVWLFTATALLVVWYQIPIRDFQRAIMLGFAPYLLLMVTFMGLLKRHGWAFRSTLGVLDAVAFISMVLFWTRAAWRADGAAGPAVWTGRPLPGNEARQGA